MGAFVIAELACQARVSTRAWKVPGIRERIESQLRYTLKAAGAYGIEIEPPVLIHVTGFVDEEGDWQPLDKPYWAWDTIAIGQSDA